MRCPSKESYVAEPDRNIHADEYRLSSTSTTSRLAPER